MSKMIGLAAMFAEMTGTMITGKYLYDKRDNSTHRAIGVRRSGICAAHVKRASAKRKNRAKYKRLMRSK